MLLIVDLLNLAAAPLPMTPPPRAKSAEGIERHCRNAQDRSKVQFARSGYAGRSAQKLPLGNAVGLTQFGVNLTRLKPGAASALRHWHENEDEFIYVLEGELVLVENEGETILRPGDAAGFKAGIPTAII